MQRILLTFFLLTIGLAAQDAPVVGAAAAARTGESGEETRQSRPKTESVSRQFVVHGSDFATRGAIASLAEETRAQLLGEVGEAEKWVHPIAIQLYGVEGDKTPARPLRSRFFKVPGGFRLQLDVHLGKGKPVGLERALLELLLIERGLREEGDGPLETALSIPPWLLDGMLESFRWRKGERNHDLYAALFEKNQLFPVRRLLETEDPGEMDSMTRAAFRASSGALVMALLKQPGGKASMAAMLKEAATFEGDEMALLARHFPGMNLGQASFAKWWALQLAHMADAPFTQLLTIRETEEELQRLLVVKFGDPAGSQIELHPEKFRDLLALPSEERRQAVHPVLERLALFQFRAFPAHRPILAEYVRILGELLNDTDEAVEERLQNLASQRADLAALGSRTRDYLEWYRITTARQMSGDFESFIQLKENLETTRSRTGHVSEYLDRMQRVFTVE